MKAMTEIRKLAVVLLGVIMAVALQRSPASAQPPNQDPAEVSDSLRAVFKLGNPSEATKARVNANTVTVMSGTIGGTYVQFGADLASVLDDGDQIRVLPIIGRGSVQSLADILFLKGVDVGIMRADTLDYLERKGYTRNVKKQLAYITKLYNEEMHVIAPKEIRRLSDLNGKTVSVDLPNGGTFVTAMTVFERLGIKPKLVFIEQRLAYEKLRKGEIDALVAVQGKPSKFITQVKDENLHLVPIDYAPALQSDYLPSRMSAEDYPALIPAGTSIDTIAVPAILAAYNWAPGTDRYRKVELFVNRLFDHLADLQKPPFHPKWQEAVLTSELPGWVRFPAAQRWLDGHVTTARTETRQSFDRFLASKKTGKAPSSDSERQALFEDFLKWESARHRAQARTVGVSRPHSTQSNVVQPPSE
jgi:TRAP transporter TAXI family solute receptor